MPNNNNFTLELDRQAPSAAFTTTPAANINDNITLQLTTTGAVAMKLWFDQVQNVNKNATSGQAGYSASYASAQWVAPAATKSTEFTVDGTADGLYYYHLMTVDGVGNESAIATAAIRVDKTLPAVSLVVTDPSHTGQTNPITSTSNIPFSVSYSDIGGSDIVSLVLSSTAFANDITLTNLDVSSLAEQTKSGTFNLVGVSDGDQVTVTVTATDAAGNTKTDSKTFYLNIGIGALTFYLKHLSTDVNPIVENAYYNLKWGGTTTDNTFYLFASSADTDIVGYKIWEGTAANEPASYSSYTSGTAFNITDSSFALADVAGTVQDGEKVIHLKIIDAGNNIKEQTVTFNVDTVAPSITAFSTSASVISGISGYDEAVLSLTAASSGAQIASYDLRVQGAGSAIDSGEVTTNSPLPSTFTIDKTDLGANAADGNYVLVLTLTDTAGNTTSDTVTIALDTAAPSFSIPTISGWKKQGFSITGITYLDAHTVTTRKVWINDNPADTDSSGATSAAAGSSPITVAVSAGDCLPGLNYIHIELTDEVGNSHVETQSFNFDDDAPTISVEFTQDAYTSKSAAIRITPADNTSGVAFNSGAQMKIWGDLEDGPTTEQTADWTAIGQHAPSTISVVLDDSHDGRKYIYVKVKDVAGNESTSYASDSCELDTTNPSASLIIWDHLNTHIQPASVTYKAFYLHIDMSDTPPSGDTDPDTKIEYKVYGNFSTTDGGSAISDSTAWITWDGRDSGKDHKVLGPYYATVSNDTVQVTLAVQDSAGNPISEGPITRTFFYDTSWPEISTLASPDVPIISCSHGKRLREVSGTVSIITSVSTHGSLVSTGADLYGDEVFFSFTPDSEISAWKVCAYASLTAARAVRKGTDAATQDAIEAQTAIPTTGGSLNMSGSYNVGQESANTIHCKLVGADYVSALDPTNAGLQDDNYVVVIYIKDAAGQWSDAVPAA